MLLSAFTRVTATLDLPFARTHYCNVSSPVVYVTIIRTLWLNFRTAPYFIMHAGHCLKENNGKNNVIAMELCAVFVVSWW